MCASKKYVFKKVSITVQSVISPVDIMCASRCLRKEQYLILVCGGCFMLHNTLPETEFQQLIDQGFITFFFGGGGGLTKQKFFILMKLGEKICLKRKYWG